MKHFYLCIVIFFIILAGGITADSLICKELDIVSITSQKISAAGKTDRSETEIGIIKNRFYSKKNMLLLFISKEHLENLETEILLMENAFIENDYDKIKESSINITVIISYIRRSLTTLT